MRTWEYQFTRYNLKDFGGEVELNPKSFYCDQRGQCFLHDTSREVAERIREVLNLEGKKGWELVQFGYHESELLCLWKRVQE